MVLKSTIHKIGGKLIKFQQSDTKFVWILAALCFLIILHPLLRNDGLSAYLLNILLGFIIVSGIVAARNIRSIIRQLIVIGLVTLVLDIVRLFAEKRQYPWLEVIVLSLYGLFIAMVTVAIIVQVAKSQKVTANIICGAIAGYLLLGLTGAFLATILERLAPGAFLVGGEIFSPGREWNSLMYYSFVTLATVGYGDITPQHEIAKSISVGIGLLGQIYLTVLVAVLVGKFLKD